MADSSPSPRPESDPYLVDLKSGVRLFIASFLVLFLELAAIRWVSAHVLYLGYFANLALLGCFLGISVGMFAARNRRLNLVSTFPLALVVLAAFVLLFNPEMVIDAPGEVYFISTRSLTQLPMWVVLPGVFLLLAIVHLGPAQEMGRLVRIGKPLWAYSLNIMGSLAGIALFYVCSLFSLGAAAWFAVAAGLYVLVARSRFKLVLLVTAMLPAALCAAVDVDAIWSPYYRIEVHTAREATEKAPPLYRLSVNNVTHQFISHPREREEFYHFPYQVLLQYLEEAPEILLIGGGVGTDTSFAMAYGVKSIDVVEIDPAIASIGRSLNPVRPYQDPRVNLTIQDGRVFMKNCDRKYDAVLFGLPDSLGLVSPSASVRLESFLFTQESFQDARKLLKEDGVFVLYNYYRHEWLVRRLANMLESVFGEHPVVLMPPDESMAAVLFAGPGAKHVPDDFGAQFGLQRLTLTDEDRRDAMPSDNWPFFYLRAPGIPFSYLALLGAVLLLTLIGVAIIWPRSETTPAGTPRRWWSFLQGHWHLFLTGAAFMLLETASIVRASLFLGATWTTNAYVFFFLLVLVLVANLLCMKFPFRNVWLWGAVLLASLAVAFVVPLSTVLEWSGPARYLAAGALMLSPVFFANLLFARFFREEEGVADLGLAANMVGAMVGGVLEYLSMATGYHVLYLAAGVLYLGALAYWFARQRMKMA
jgi:SAM-dependent methyltransferase